MVFLLLLQLWSGATKVPPDPNILLSGNWQSCRSEDTPVEYAERIYERMEMFHGVRTWLWSFHMGPYHEFGLFRADRDPSVAGGDDIHTTQDNLLGPAFEVVPEFNRAQRTWRVEGSRLRLPYDLWINVVLAGGSRDECESFFVLIRKEHSR